MKKTGPITGKEVNWNQLFYFCEVAAHGSMKEAGETLGLSPSTLSEHVAQLEGDLRIQLFHRHHRRLELTAEGAKLFQHAKPMFETGLRMLDVVSPLPLGHYPVTIGMVPGFGLPLGYELIHQFIQVYRSGKVHLEHSEHDELERGLSESKYDFGFSYRMPERKDIHYSLVRETSLGFYVSPRVTGDRLDVLLSEMPLLLFGDPYSRRGVEALLEKGDLTPSSVITSDYLSFIMDLCLKGQGVAVFGDDAVQESSFKSLRRLRWPGALEKSKERLYALWPIAGEKSAAVQQLQTLLGKKK